MSHFTVYVVVPPGYDGEIEEFVAKAMDPYDENKHETDWVVDEDYPNEPGYFTNAKSFWDWYQIGGRASGLFSEQYDPRRDHRNWERCWLCGGTGIRSESGIRADGTPWCNGCTPDREEVGLPVGVMVKYPTQWVNDVGNVARLGEIREFVTENPPYILLTEGPIHHWKKNPDWNGKFGPDDPPYELDNGEEVVKAIAALSDDCTIVVVDCHV